MYIYIYIEQYMLYMKCFPVRVISNCILPMVQQKFTCITTKCFKMLVHVREFSKLILQFFVICLSVRFSSEF